jgi:hypothetical protein
MANQNYEQKQSQNLSDEARGNKTGQNASDNRSEQPGRKDQVKSPGARPTDEDEE